MTSCSKNVSYKLYISIERYAPQIYMTALSLQWNSVWTMKTKNTPSLP